MVAGADFVNSNEIEHSGFVGLIGRPNVGKSTLINQLARRKLAAVTAKPQTTRHQIRGVVNLPDAQIVFIDTPGFHKPKDSLGGRLNRKVKDTMAEVDVVLFLLDVAAGIGTGDAYIAHELKKVRTPVVIGLNKIDLLDPEGIAQQRRAAAELAPEAGVLAISAIKGEGLVELVDRLSRMLPPGPKFYPEGMLTDQPEQTLMAEFIREKLMERLRDEVPYAVAVEIYEVKPRKGRDLIDVYGRIHVERDSQKGMVIGHGGKVLSEIGRLAREEIEALLGSRIYLDLIVKVTKDWRRKDRKVEELGY
jgi:GTPase